MISKSIAYQRNNTVLFCGLESENGCATDFISDSGRDIASDITTEIFFKELFSDLTEKENRERLYSNTDGNTEFNYEKKNWGSEIAIRS